MIYCWRGGKRSGSMTAWFNLIGWRARQLEGGYKTYRHSVVEALEALPPRFRYQVVAGHTGSGKTRLLHALAQAGAQSLDLEALAAHRGSLLGGLPGGAPQPAQKAFDTALIGALRGFDPARPVFVEAESKRIGRITLPASLMRCMQQAPCVNVEVAADERVALLRQDYDHLFEQPGFFKAQLARLVPLHGHAVVDSWHALLDQDRRDELFRELIERHYDPTYARSGRRQFGGLAQPLRFAFRPTAPDVAEQARELLARLGG